MENSGPFLFKDDSVCWYVAEGEQWTGPMKASEVYEMIQNHQISWVHFVWKKGQPGWQRVCEVAPFEEYAPSQSQPKSKPTDQPPQPAFQGERKWFLHYNESQFGPFSHTEVVNSLRIEKITPRVHAWCQGMVNWERIERIAEFQGVGQGTEVIPPQFRKSKKAAQNDSFVQGQQYDQQQRIHPRRPLVAKMILSDDQSVILGVCRDISMGGMQVLIDEAPVKTGILIRMNVSPSTNETGPTISPFVAEGKVVRILEDGRGFSFRFTKLSDTAKKSIETYIESND